MTKEYSVLYKVLIYILVGLIFILFLRNLDNPNLWFDESGQFWMSMGLNHYSSPYSKAGGLLDIIYNNSKYNMDPGGYTLLLRPWLEISTNTIWLRGFSFLFFLFTLAIFIYYCRRWTGDLLFAVIISLLLFASPYVIQNSFELRPYSWSFFSIICCFFIVEKLKSETRLGYFGVAGLLLGILMWGRYNCIVQVFGSILVLFILLYNQDRKFYSVCKKIIIMSLPVLISLIAILIITFANQRIGSTTAEYVKWITIRYNLSYFASFPFWGSVFPLIIYLVFYIIVKKQYSNNITPSLDVLFYFTIVENILFVILSILGFYPYSFRHRWNVDLHVLSLLNLCSVVCVIYNYISYNKRIGERSNLLNYIGVSFCLIVLLLQLFSTQLKSFKYQEGEKTSFMLQLLSNKNVNSITISQGYYPNVRYLYEYGSLQDNESKSKLYPNNILFINTLEIDLSDVKTDGLIVDDQKQINNVSTEWSCVSLEKVKFFYRCQSKH
ncbi:MAG: hypothetical protein LUH63_14710 [Parabacteroides sp.]|nr:hypothetical protein [Parabacteroides sp.]